MSVVEWKSLSLNFLVGFMAFACDEDDVTGFCQGCSGPDGFSSVNDSYALPFFNGVEALLHVLQDEIGVLAPRIVTGEEDAIRAFGGGLGHERSLFGVSVTSAPDYGDDMLPTRSNMRNGGQHIFERVRGMGIINNYLGVVWMTVHNLHAPRH